ncbi:MAG: (2Fe-2S) ferredoxin domain-containing protein [Methylobacter sp.]
MPKVTLLVCTNYRHAMNQPSCGARGSEQLLYQFKTAAEEQGIDVEASCCFGHCTDGAVVKIAPNGRFYHGVTEYDISQLVSDAIQLNAALSALTA